MPNDPRYKTPEWLATRKIVKSRARGRCQVDGCPRFGLVADHIVAPNNDGAFFDLNNLRWLCRDHDNQIKEDAQGQRRRAGKPFVRGCDAQGWPLDPGRAAR